MDTCLSIYFQLFKKSHDYAFDLGELGDYYRHYKRLMDHWISLFPEQVLTVQYETLIENQEQESRRIIDFCGLDWDDSCLDYQQNARVVNTASSWQVRQPIYKSSSGRWKHYEKHLGPLKAALFGG